jgi:hypothetical protein
VRDGQRSATTASATTPPFTPTIKMSAAAPRDVRTVKALYGAAAADKVRAAFQARGIL